MSKPVGYPDSTNNFWNRFYEISQVPRPSKKELKFIKFLENVAEENNLKYKKDSANNIVIYLPATKGYEEKPTIIIQSHMDMVCDKTPDRNFDFENDPIDLLVEDGWVTADRTTLGADNGLGVAASLALIDEKDIDRPALELLFTVDEETGLNGAIDLDTSMLTGKKLINLDTEEWGAVYVGCAGGVDYKFEGSFEIESNISEKLSYSITIGGLKGGHSGMNIHEGRGNSIKILGQLLLNIVDFDLISIEGGAAHNIIPRDAIAKILIDKRDHEKLKAKIHVAECFFKTFLKDCDQNFFICLDELNEDGDYKLTSDSKAKLLKMITLFPHGAYGYNWEADCPLVTHSSNMAILKCFKGEVYLLTSIRFFEKNEALEIEEKMKVISDIFGISLERGKAYPSWKPEFDSELLEKVKLTYKEKTGVDIKVKAIHAGLECGILKDKLGELEAISLGPNIEGVHSPSERMEIKSTNLFWDFFLKLLGNI